MQLGEALVACIHPRDLELLSMSRAQLDDLMASMLSDLKNVLDTLATGMLVKVGGVQPLPVMTNARDACQLMVRLHGACGKAFSSMRVFCCLEEKHSYFAARECMVGRREIPFTQQHEDVWCAHEDPEDSRIPASRRDGFHRARALDQLLTPHPERSNPVLLATV